MCKYWKKGHTESLKNGCFSQIFLITASCRFYYVWLNKLFWGKFCISLLFRFLMNIFTTFKISASTRDYKWTKFKYLSRSLVVAKQLILLLSLRFCFLPFQTAIVYLDGCLHPLYLTPPLNYPMHGPNGM